MRHEALSQKDKKYLWHPFTQQKEWEKDPDIPVIVRGKGTSLYDAKGRRYLDGVSSLWCNVHGHQVPEIDKAVQKQLKKIAHSTLLGASNEPAILLAERLLKMAPRGLTRVFYSDSGSEANEIAMKMAFQYWRQCPNPKPLKKSFLTIREGYHGDTIGSVSMGGIDLFHSIFGELLFKTFQAPSPHALRRGRSLRSKEWLRESVEAFEKILKKSHSKIAAVHMEPLIEGAGGMLAHPPGYLKAVRRLCDNYSVLLVLDEVATGFGRTGTLFACQREGVRPDILCLAKNLTGGYLPLAATLTSEKIYKSFLGTFESGRTFYHGHTFTGNQLACAAALANLSLIQRPSFMKSIREKSRFLERLMEPLKENPHVADIRLVGLMGGIDLVKNKKTGEEYPYAQKIGYKVCAEARKEGVLLRPLGNTLVLMPPLVISSGDLTKLVRAISKGIQRACD